jgi:hypothetical protein
MDTLSALVTVCDLNDFQRMFALSPTQLDQSIMLFSPGISPVPAMAYRQGHGQWVACDPYYDLSPMDMFKHVNFVQQRLFTQPEYINQCQAASDIFLSDYAIGQQQGRYRVSLDNSSRLQLILCPNMFHAMAPEQVANTLQNLSERTQEIRVFPIQDEQGALLPSLALVMFSLQRLQLGVEIKETPWLICGKPSVLLRVWSKACGLST